MPVSALSAVLLGLATLYAVLYRLQLRRRHPDEPPVIPAPGLPFVGHVLLMALQGGRYLQQLGLRLAAAQRGGPGIVTLPVPGSRIYLVTDPSLAAAVQRASRTLSFTPLVPDITRRVLGLDAATVRIVRGDNLVAADAQRYDESHGFLADMHALVYAYLGPGDPLTALVHDAAAELVGQVNACAADLSSSSSCSASAPPIVDLLAWTKHLVTVGTARFLYGPRNPLAVQPDLEPAFWDFVHGLGRLLLVGDRPAGSLAVRLLGGGRALAARERLVDGFRAYLEADEHAAGGHALVRQRVALADRYGWTRASTARSELSFLFAGIINTAVTSFWLVLRLFADPALLQRVRAELEAGVVDDADDADGSRRRQALSIDHVQTRCPTLRAVYHECLRTGSNNMSTRLVLADTVLADRHFLRAGAVVQIAAGVLHADPALWGPDADVFDPGRFLEGKDEAAAAAGGRRRAPAAAFRAFGGGKTLCPGRHFATAEILTFAAAVVLTFEADDAAHHHHGGPPKVPPRNDRVLPVHILEPAAADAPQVRLRLRRPRRGPVTVVP